jgi:hypothetical protein
MGCLITYHLCLIIKIIKFYNSTYFFEVHVQGMVTKIISALMVN